MNSSLRRIFAVAGRELRSSSSSPLMWVFLTVFILLTGFCTFIAGNLLGSGQADLQPFFDWQGWMLLIFVPALGMPLWAEELRAGTFELLLSFPGRIWQLVLGKYLAGLAMLAAALLLTLPTPLTVIYLGKPDLGAIACGYFAAFLLGACYLAASCLCSALSRSQTASFLLSLCFATALMLMGWPTAMETLSGWGAPEWLLSLLPVLGATPHYQSFVRGIFDSSDLLYFIAACYLFIFLAAETLELAAAGASRGLLRRGMMSDPATRYLAWGLLSSTALACAIVALLLAVCSKAKLRADLTSDRAFSLSQEAAKIAAGLDQKLRIRFYFNPSRRMPDGLRSYGERVEWLLEEFAAASKGKVVLTKLRPEPDTEDEESAVMDGLKPVPLNTGDRMFLGLSISHGGRSCPIPFLSPQNERLLESDICRAVLNATRKERPKVGVMSALPVLGQSLPDGSIAQTPGAPQRPWQAFIEIQEDFAIFPIPMEPNAIPDDLACLVVLHPSGIGVQAQYQIDQYLLRGGNVAVFVDPRSFYAVLKSQKDQSFIDKVESDLPKLLPAWGVAYNKNIMLADMLFAFRKNLPDKIVTNPMVLTVSRDGMNPDDPLTGSLSSLSFYFSGILQADPPPGLRAESLVFSSTQSQAISSHIGERSELVMRNFAPSGVKYSIGVKLSGSFKSAFPEGMGGEAAHLAVSKKPGQAVVFADSDMLFNDVCVRQAEDSLGQRSIVRMNDNISLLQNVLESLCGSGDLASVRARIPMSRPFVKIDKIKADAEMAYRNRILDLEKGLMETQGKLNRLQAMKSKDEQTILSPEQREQLKELSAKSDDAKRVIKTLRRKLRSDLESLELQFKLLNVAVAPAFVALFGLGWLLWPRRRKGASK